ncbi:hypothetical protein DFA_05468 [Cavenderia fasciculata]|uniref:3'-5' exonuclease n=1 Tax=Cavenderia fasciculata TaxID=261658 RepID=F4PLB4_CACFS|nr:uncharacterized protein DFA_05468 [Cavenderia fasciculata]EGG23336.1 hypothetical protein DFA_05468 [Cavenderia fasciculata]|eukprot:XP_004361187.1 hypothetical protein DFA_05468 [Cavenderia fasciculata]
METPKLKQTKDELAYIKRLVLSTIKKSGSTSLFTKLSNNYSTSTSTISGRSSLSSSCGHDGVIQLNNNNKNNYCNLYSTSSSINRSSSLMFNNSNNNHNNQCRCFNCKSLSSSSSSSTCSFLPSSSRSYSSSNTDDKDVINHLNLRNVVVVEQRRSTKKLEQFDQLLTDQQLLPSDAKIVKLTKKYCIDINISKVGKKEYYKITFPTRLEAIEFYNRLCLEKKRLGDESIEFLFKIPHTQLDPMYEIKSEEMLALDVGEVTNTEVIDSEEQAVEAVSKLLDGKMPWDVKVSDAVVLGMDCEWPALRKFLTKEDPKISLIQLSNGEYTALFRICKFEEIPDALVQLLTSRSILKVGHGLSKDANRLNKEQKICMDGVDDLAYHPVTYRCNPDSINDMVAMFLNTNITRRASVIRSNWGTSQDLTHEQILSAAQRSHFSRQLYFKLQTVSFDIDLSQ